MLSVTFPYGFYFSESFFDTYLIFPPLFSFNIIEKRKKRSYSSGFSKKKYIFAIELQISKRYIDMKKEKNFSETVFLKKKALESLSDDEILQGFKDAEHDGFENML